MAVGAHTSWKVTEEMVDRIVELYRDEMFSLPMVGRRMGLDHATVLYHLKKRGIPRRTPQEGYDLWRMTS